MEQSRTSPWRTAHRGWVRLAVPLVAAGLVVSACSGSDPGTPTGQTAGSVNQAAPRDEGTPVDGGTLRVALPAEIDGLNPVNSRWSVEGNLLGSSVFDTLLTFDENRNLVPRLASSVTPNADGTVWTIKLRDGVKFHDGSPLDSAAVKLNIETRKADPITGSALAPVSEVVAVDDLTTEVRMSTPWFGYDYTIAAQGGYMVAPAQIKAEGGGKDLAIGTGPFQQAEPFTPGVPIKVKRFGDYWGEKAHLDGITFTALVDDQARAAALKSGDLDLMLTQNAQSIVEFRSTEGFVQVEDFLAEEAFAMLNLALPPFDNLNARKALAYATDRQAIVDGIGQGVTKEADGPYAEGEKYHPDDANYPSFDQAKAREAIEAYQRETGQPELAFTISTSAGEQRTAEVLQAQWSEVGIKATIDSAEQAKFLAGMFTSQFQVAMFRNFAYVNPDSNYIFWHSSQAKGVGKGSINFGQIRSDALDKALDTARSTNDEATRTEQYRQLTPILNAEVPYIWLYHNDWALTGTDKVGGLGVAQRLGFGRQDAKPIWAALWLNP